MERDGHRCQIKASKKCRSRANCIDHIERPEDRPDLAVDPDNLRASCRSCNLVRHNVAYFRERVDGTGRTSGRLRVGGSPSRSGDPDKFIPWAMSLPLLDSEPKDHGHDRWGITQVHYHRQVFAVCPPSCTRAPVLWWSP